MSAPAYPTTAYGAMLCPVPECREHLAVHWEGWADLFLTGLEVTNGAQPDDSGFWWWSVGCTGDHTLVTARDEFPGYPERREADDLTYTDEEGYPLDLDLVRTRLRAIHAALNDPEARS